MKGGSANLVSQSQCDWTSLVDSASYSPEDVELLDDWEMPAGDVVAIAYPSKELLDVGSSSDGIGRHLLGTLTGDWRGSLPVSGSNLNISMRDPMDTNCFIHSIASDVLGSFPSDNLEMPSEVLFIIDPREASKLRTCQSRNDPSLGDGLGSKILSKEREISSSLRYFGQENLFIGNSSRQVYLFNQLHFVSKFIPLPAALKLCRSSKSMLKANCLIIENDNEYLVPNALAGDRDKQLVVFGNHLPMGECEGSMWSDLVDNPLML